MSDIPQQGTNTQASKNIIRTLFQPQNRTLLVCLLFLVLIIVVGVSVSIYRVVSNANPQLVSVDTSVEAAPQVPMTGKETEAYLKTLREYNEDRFEAESKERNPDGSLKNPSLHPAAIDQSEDSELEPCGTDDSVCMRDRGLIGAGECAPEDLSCDIETDTCSPSDTVCMRERGLIGMSECAPQDYACKHQQIENTSQESSPRYDEEYISQLNQELSRIQSRKSNFQMTEYAISESKEIQSQLPLQNSSVESEIPVKRTLVEAMTVDYATSELALSSDYQGPVWLTIAGGSRDGWELLGNMELVNERLLLTLNTMKTNDGRVYSINAIVLDPKTSYAVFKGEIDRHLLYRYGFWGLGTALKAIGDVTRLSGTRVVVNEGVSQSSTNLSANDKALIAVGELGGQLGSNFQDRLNRPAEVKAKPGDEMAVFFLDEVIENH